MRQAAVRDFASKIDTARTMQAPLPMGVKIRPGLMTITPELAARILAENLFSGQRNKKPIVRVIADEMRRGFFTPGMQIHFGNFEGKLHLVNGQQRLYAVVESETPIEFSILITECETENDLQALYWRHDTVASPRSMRDVLRAAGTAKDQGISVSDEARMIASVKTICGGLTTPNGLHGICEELKSPDRALEAAKPWRPYASQYLACLDRAPTFNGRLFRRRLIMAAGMVTIKHQPAKAEEFWRGAAEDDGLKRHDPRKQLLTFLTANVVNSSSYQSMMRACSLSWNAWFEDRSVATLKANADFKIMFLGTPIGRGKKGAA